MDAAMGSRWTPLQLDQLEGTQPLLLKSSFQPTGYTVSVTDLGYLWSEILDRDQIIQRASEDKTSIDPSEDSSQLEILLQKVRDALQSRSNGSSLRLSRTDDDEGLALVVTATLPPPLASLRWIMRLKPESWEAFKREVVHDLLAMSFLQGRYIAELKKQLSEKDHVISKLLDRQESSGVDISTVFPGIKQSRWKGTTREQAGRVVRGLAPFDEGRSWENAVPGRPQDVSVNGLVDGVFNDVDGSSSLPAVKLAMKEFTDGNWWERLEPLDATGSHNRQVGSDITAQHGKSSRSTGLIRKESTFEDSNEFQRQATPDRLKDRGSPNLSNLNHAKERSHEPDGDTTDSDNEQAETDGTASVTRDDVGRLSDTAPTKDEPKRPSTEKSLQATSAPTHKKMGVIGGRKAQPVSPVKSVAENIPSPVSPPARRVGENDGGLSRPTTAESALSTATPAKHKLGTIGGRKKPETVTTKPLAGEDVTTEPKIPANAIKPQPEPDINARPKWEQPKAAEIPQESSQEKANRLREELKHDLESKSKTQPKKRRRF